MMRHIISTIAIALHLGTLYPLPKYVLVPLWEKTHFSTIASRKKRVTTSGNVDYWLMTNRITNALHGCIENIEVEPKARGHGLGDLLLTTALKSLKKYGSTFTFLYAWPFNCSYEDHDLFVAELIKLAHLYNKHGMHQHPDNKNIKETGIFFYNNHTQNIDCPLCPKDMILDTETVETLYAAQVRFYNSHETLCELRYTKTIGQKAKLTHCCLMTDELNKDEKDALAKIICKLIPCTKKSVRKVLKKASCTNMPTLYTFDGNRFGDQILDVKRFLIDFEAQP